MNIKRLLLILSLFALMLSQGCKETDQSILRFNHYQHVTGMKLDCDSCHGQAKGRFTLPDHQNCSECHSKLMKAEQVSKDTCGVCHKEQDLGQIGEMAPAKRVSRQVFFHSEALGNYCNDCHDGTLREDADGRLMTRDDVIRTREQSHETGRPCSQCHLNITRESLPANHQVNWKKRHGVFAADEEFTCSVCHEENTCKECHMSEEPDSHNTLWVNQTHGIEGSWNRASCRVCHQDDFCAGCHRDTKPRSHTSMWIGQHGAFAPASFASCQVCHPKEQCQACHRTEEPASHVGNWEEIHCLNCHISAPIQIECKVCHVGGAAEQHLAVAPLPPAWHALPAQANCLDLGCHNPAGPQPLDPTKHTLDQSVCLVCHPF
ncbi:MAG: hypothetical protein ABFS09_07615 [Thermodesulfobacteriota bacterium]